ncbi:hypothetical protein D7D52_32375 [Nocardia yunnanensis]|uniref:Uncharacterized protein n=1 Tax=Nocardia yunnanensis TaxID=2382165 RepID=A0A386ZIJ4_9NOCA|nr:hypothetical protein D7D52_32375 [Nocardia yunnanensis]
MAFSFVDPAAVFGSGDEFGSIGALSGEDGQVGGDEEFDTRTSKDVEPHASKGLFRIDHGPAVRVRERRVVDPD